MLLSYETKWAPVVNIGKSSGVHKLLMPVKQERLFILIGLCILGYVDFLNFKYFDFLKSIFKSLMMS